MTVVLLKTNNELKLRKCRAFAGAGFVFLSEEKILQMASVKSEPLPKILFRAL